MKEIILYRLKKTITTLLCVLMLSTTLQLNVVYAEETIPTSTPDTEEVLENQEIQESLNNDVEEETPIDEVDPVQEESTPIEEYVISEQLQSLIDRVNVLPSINDISLLTTIDELSTLKNTIGSIIDDSNNLNEIDKEYFDTNILININEESNLQQAINNKLDELTVEDDKQNSLALLEQVIEHISKLPTLEDVEEACNDVENNLTSLSSIKEEIESIRLIVEGLPQEDLETYNTEYKASVDEIYDLVTETINNNQVLINPSDSFNLLLSKINDLPTNEEIQALIDRSDIFSNKSAVSYIKSFVDTYKNPTKIRNALAIQRGVNKSEITSEEITNAQLTNEEVNYYNNKYSSLIEEKATLLDALLVPNGDYNKLSSLITDAIDLDTYNSLSDDFKAIIEILNTLPLNQDEVSSLHTTTEIGNVRGIVRTNGSIDSYINVLTDEAEIELFENAIAHFFGNNGDIYQNLMTRQAELNGSALTARGTAVGTKAALVTALENGGTYYLSASFSTSGTALNVKKNTTLDLNGKTITLGSGNGINIYDDITFTLNDSSSGGTGTINGNNDGTRGFYVSGTFNFNGGTIKNCSLSSEDGAAILTNWNTGAVVNMKGGTIDSCKTGQVGGGIQVDGNAKFNMSGGTIKNCSADGGGAVIAKGSIVDGTKYQAEFNMSGGTIKDCSARDCGGVFCKGGKFTMTGGLIENCKSTDGKNTTTIVSTWREDHDISSTIKIDGGVLGKEGTGTCTTWRSSGHSNTFTFTSGKFNVENNYSNGSNTSSLTATPAGGTSTVTFNHAGGTGGLTTTKSYTWNNTPAKITSLPLRTGYTFDGYYDKENGEGDQYFKSTGEAAKKWDYVGAVTLYAKWTANTYTIKFDGNEATSGTAPADITATYNANVTMPANPFTKTGYTFLGWVDVDVGTVYTAGAATTTPPNLRSSQGGSITLYAKWTPNTYTVTFDKQSGTSGSDSVTATYNAAMPSMTKPTRSGYHFKGYFTDKNGAGTKYYNEDGTSAKKWDKTSNTTLYAYWWTDVSKPSDKSTTYNGTEQTYAAPTNTTLSSGGKGTNVGTYTATIKPASGYCWPDGSTTGVDVDFVINKKTVTLTWGDTLTWTYDGTAHSTTCTLSGRADTDTATHIDVSLSGNSITNAGTATVTASLKGTKVDNYKLPTTYTKTLTINPKALTASLSQTTYTYNGEENKPTVNLSNTVSGKAPVLGADYTVAYTNNTNAGTGTATVTWGTTTTAKNYSLATKAYNFTINPKALTASLSTTEYTYDGNEKKPTVNLSGYISGKQPVLGADYTVAYTNNTNAGTGTATVTWGTTTTAKNYSLATKAYNFTIDKADGSYVTTSWEGATNLTYNGSNQNLLKTAPVFHLGKSGTNMYAVTAQGASRPADSAFSSSLPQAKAAGNYTIHLYCAETANYTKSKYYSMDVSIAKRSITPVLSYTTAQVYTGNEFKPNISNFTNKVSGDTITSGSGKEYTLSYANNTNVGTATVTINWGSTAIADNYTLSTNKLTFSITDAAITVTAPNQEYTYDGNPHGDAITAKGVDKKTVTVMYRNVSTGSYNLDSAPQITNVKDSKTIYWQATLDNHTTETGSYTITIKKATPTVIKPTVNDLTFNHNAQVIAAEGTTTGGTLEYALGSNGTTVPTTGWKTTLDKQTNAGDYHVWYRVTGNDNWNSVAAQYAGKAVIKKATINAVSTDGLATWSGSATNGGAHVEVTLPTSGATVEYGTTEGTYNLDAIPTYTNAGTYTIYYKVSADNYNDKTGSFTITINKANLGDKPSATVSKTYTGSELDNGISYNTNGYVTKDGNYKGTNAGIYTVKYTPDANHMWSDGSRDTVTVKFTINRASIGDKPTNPSAVVFTGEEQINGISYNDNSFVNKSGNYKGTNAGTYTATYTPDENHCWSDDTYGGVSITFVINRATIGPRPTNPIEITYDRNEHNNGVVYNSGYTDKLSISGNIIGTNAGTYTATYTPDANHCWNSIDDYAAVNIVLKINPYNISLAQIDSLDPHDYAGKYAYEDESVKNAYLNPVVKALETALVQGEDKDFVISYDKPTIKTVSPYDATVTLTVTGKGNYVGTKTITYKETRKSYTVTYDGNGTTENVPTPGTEYYDIPFNVTSNYPTRTGATFVGWAYSEAALKEHKITIINDENKNKDITLYAIWQFDVTLHGNGGTITRNVTEYTYSNTDVMLPTSNNDTTYDDEVYRVGYKFEGWFDNAEFSGTPFTKIDALSSGAKEFFAKWAPREDIKYVIKHVKQNLDCETYVDLSTYTKASDSDEKVLVEELVGTADTNISPVAKNFDGFVSPSVQTANIDPDGSRVFVYNYQRRKDYFVEVAIHQDSKGLGQINENTYAMVPNIPYEGEISVNANTITIAGFDVIARAIDSDVQYTYSFDKWIDGTNKTLTGTFELKDSMAIYACFKKEVRKYTVKYLDGDGEVYKTISNVLYGSNVKDVFDDSLTADPTKSEDHRATYAFTGYWGLNSETYDENLLVTGDITVYPVFDETIKSYPVIFDGNGGKFTISASETDTYEVNVPYGSLFPANMPVPEKESDASYEYEWIGYKVTPSAQDDGTWLDAPVVGEDNFTGDTWNKPTYYAVYQPILMVEKYNLTIVNDESTSEYGSANETVLMQINSGSLLSFTNNTIKAQDGVTDFVKSSTLKATKSNKTPLLTANAIANNEDNFYIYEFDHWTVQKKTKTGGDIGTPVILTADSSFVFDSDAVATASFKAVNKTYSLSLNANVDGAVSFINPINGQTYSSLPTTYKAMNTTKLPIGVKEGYEFLGWSTTSDGDTYIDELTSEDYGNKVLYARWNVISKYSITINTESIYENDIKGGVANVSVNPELSDGKVVENVEYTLVAQMKSNTGSYSFSGWKINGVELVEGVDYSNTETKSILNYTFTDEKVMTYDGTATDGPDFKVVALYEYNGDTLGNNIRVNGDGPFTVSYGEEEITSSQAADGSYYFEGYVQAYKIITLSYTGDKLPEWINERGAVLSNDNDYQFESIFSRQLSLKTIEKDGIFDSYYVEARSLYDQLLKTGTITTIDELKAFISDIKNPASLGKEFDYWSFYDGSKLAEDTTYEDLNKYVTENTANKIVLTPRYKEPTQEATITLITVLEGKTSTRTDTYTYNLGENVTLNAKTYKGLHFAYWGKKNKPTDDDYVILGTSETYPLQVGEDRTIYAIYTINKFENILPTLQVTLVSSSVDAGYNYLNFQVTRDIPDNYELKAHGVLYRTKAFAGGTSNSTIEESIRFVEDPDIGELKPNEYVTNKVGKDLSKHNGYTLLSKIGSTSTNANADKVMYLRGYIVVSDGEKTDIYYTDVHCVCLNDILLKREYTIIPTTKYPKPVDSDIEEPEWD